MATLPRT
jgi:DNA-binding phage protein